MRSWPRSAISATAGRRRSPSTPSPAQPAGRANARRARSLLAGALAILQELGDRRGVARVLTHLADLALSDGDGAAGP